MHIPIPSLPLLLHLYPSPFTFLFHVHFPFYFPITLCPFCVPSPFTAPFPLPVPFTFPLSPFLVCSTLSLSMSLHFNVVPFPSLVLPMPRRPVSLPFPFPCPVLHFPSLVISRFPCLDCRDEHVDSIRIEMGTIRIQFFVFLLSDMYHIWFIMGGGICLFCA